MHASWCWNDCHLMAVWKLQRCRHSAMHSFTITSHTAGRSGCPIHMLDACTCMFCMQTAPVLHGARMQVPAVEKVVAISLIQRPVKASMTYAAAAQALVTKLEAECPHSLRLAKKATSSELCIGSNSKVPGVRVYIVRYHMFEVQAGYCSDPASKRTVQCALQLVV